MPATGLPDVKQRIGVDYDDGYKKIAEDAIAFAAAAREAKDAMKEYLISAKDTHRAQVELREQFTLLGRTFGDNDTALREHIDQVTEAREGYARLTEASREQADAVRNLSVVHDDANTAISRGTDALEGYRLQLKSVRQEAESAAIGIQGIQQATGDYLSRARLGRGDSGGAVQAIRAASAAGGSSGINDIFAAMGVSPGGGGGGGDKVPSFNPLAGNFGQAIRFWGMMTAEVAATVVPALTAAGTAALVGVQSVEAMVPRYKAIFSTSEALGGAYNMTTGKFLGGGTALQDAQNAFQGGGYDIAGSALSIIQSGGGKGFINMGEQTLSMLARGTAATAINFQQGGLGKKLSDALSGGPGYLRDFGDIGANLGNTLLNVAPHLPGVGQDLLGTLKGGTGLLATLTRDAPGDVLGGGLAYEAASRWLPALLGGKGLIGRMLGLRGAGGIGGLIGKAGGFLAEKAPLGSGLESLGFDLSGLGGGLSDLALGAAGGPILGAAGLTAFTMAQLAGTMPSSAQRQMMALQGQVSQAGFTNAWQPLAHAITKATGMSVPGGPGVDMMGSNQSPESFARFGPIGPTTRQVYQGAALGFETQLSDLTNSAPQLTAALKKAGLKGVGFADALQIGQNALLDLGHSFGKDGKLTRVAQQMVTDYAKVLAPMTQSPGAFGAAVAGQTIMSQGAMKNLSNINQALDGYQQIIAGGPTGASALAAGAGAAPAGAIAKGLTGYTSSANAAAWQAFTSTSTSAPGFITQMQQFGDQMRTYLTLGTANVGQTKGFSASELQKILPQAKQSPAALAMLMQQGASMGVTGYYDTSKSQAQNYKDVAAALHSTAYSSAQFKKNMDSVTIATANMPQVAKQFADATATSMQSQRVAAAATDALKIQKMSLKGVIDQGSVSDLVNQLKTAGIRGGAALKQTLDAELQGAGVSAAMRKKIELQVDTAKAQAQINGVKGKNVDINIMTKGAQQAQAAMDAIHGKTVTITVVERVLQQVTQSGAMAAAASGIPAFSMPGGPAGMRIHAQTGGMVPGSGAGDIIPAMLEPGEAIVPRYLVPMIAPFLAAHKVPGFGGVPQSGASHFAAGGMVPHMLGFPDPTRDSGSLGNKFTYTLIDDITKALNQTGAQKIASALVNKIGQEISYAKSTSAAMKSGLNLGGMDVSTGSVQDQMQSYLSSMRSFSGDLKALTKGHLNKDLIKQLVAAGPVQGDALAQSILTGGGTSGSGIKAANQLYAQIGKMSNVIGSQAAMAQYGGKLSPNLKSGTFVTNNVSISVASQGGSNIGGLTDKDITQLVAMIQKKLLEQAARNRKTGLKLKGRDA